MKLLWIFMTFLAGVLLPIQAGLNTKLGKSIGSPFYASLFSFAIGAVVLFIWVLLAKTPVVLANVKNISWYEWIGGVCGAFYVTIIVLAFPRIGPALTFGLVVAGQMVVALLLDHFNVLVSQPHPVNVWRILGVLLIVSGVIVIRKY